MMIVFYKVLLILISGGAEKADKKTNEPKKEKEQKPAPSPAEEPEKPKAKKPEEYFESAPPRYSRTVQAVGPQAAFFMRQKYWLRKFSMLHLSEILLQVYIFARKKLSIISCSNIQSVCYHSIFNVYEKYFL